ncbi:MAG: sigma-70 family RNA polymerase sigma factor [Sedimentisphaeraceae bacterium JB056]
MKDDKKVIKDCLKGSHQAFARLVDKYKSFVCSIAYCMTGNIDSSEDIAQDVFISVWRDLPQLNDYSKFKNWLRSITHNKTCSYLKSDIKHSAVDIESVAVAAPDKKQNNENELIWQTLETLPAEYREVMVQYYRHEKSAKQVGELMGISADAVRQRLSRGRQMIRERIEDRLEAGLRNSAPDKKFTASVITAISSIPVGVAVSEAAAVSTSVSAPFTVALKTIMATTAAKVATVAIIAAAAIATGLILSNNEKSQPIQRTEAIQPVTATGSSPVETHFNASENLTQPIVTPIPQELQQSPAEQQAPETPQPTESPAATEETTNAFTPRGVLSGLITDKETGEPVIDAQISVTLPNNHIEQTHADENGFYYFEKLPQYGNCKLDVTSIDYVSLQNSTNDKLNVNLLAENQTIQHLELEKACLLEVLVVDEEDKPIEGAEVTIFDSFKEFKIVNTRRKTNQEGRLVTGGIKPSKASYPVMVIQKRRAQSSNGISDFCRDYSPTHANVILDNPEIMKSIKIVMQKGFDIRGRLLYADKVPASDLIITVEPKWWKDSSLFSESSIEEDGAFIINKVTSDNYNINVLIPTGDGRLSQRRIATQYLDEGNFLDFVLPFNSPSNLVNFSGKLMFEGEIKSGIIIIRGRSDISEFSRSIYCSEDDIQDITFDIERVQPGLYSVDITGKGVEDVYLKNVQIPINDFTQTLKCVVDKVVTGIVIDKKTQKTLNNFKVKTHPVKLYEGKSHSFKESWIRYSSQNGRLELDVEYDGIYEFTVTAENYAPQIVTIDTLKNRSFVAEMIEGNKLKGRVIDSNGRPVKNAKLIPFTINGNYNEYNKDRKEFCSEKYSCTTLGDGSFILRNLPEKSETIKILHPNFVESLIDIELPYTGEFVATLTHGSSIQGYVYDNHGNTKNNITISLTNEPTDFRGQSIIKQTTTDDTGYYQFTNIDNMPFYVKIRSTEEVEGVSRCYVMPQKEEKTNLDLGGNFFLKGRIFVNNIPLANTHIAIIDSPSYIYSDFKNNGMTKPDGSFIFSGITEGIKRLVYKTDNNDWLSITELDTKGIDFNIGNIFIDVVDIEVKIHSTDIIKQCSVTESFEYPSQGKYDMIPSGNNTFTTENIQPGKHVLMIVRKPNYAVFAEEIDVSNSETPLVFDIELPIANSSIYGHCRNDRRLLVKREDNSFFKFIHRENNEYKINNMPAGKYVVETYPERDIITTFELGEDQELELNFDDLP